MSRTRNVFFALLFVAGCGTSSPPPKPDGGVDMSGDMASSMGDMARQMVLNGTNVQNGKYTLIARTDDDHVLYNDSMNNVNAIALAGGTPIPVAGGGPVTFTSGNNVFVWTNYDSMTGVGDFGVWTVAGGLKPVVTGTSIAPVRTNGFAGIPAISDDGSKIIFLQGASGDASTADVYFGNADGTGTATKLWSTVATASLTIEFHGSHFFVRHTSGGMTDGGVAVATVSSVDMTGTPTDITATADTNTFGVDKAGDKVIVADALTTAATVYPPTGGAGTQVAAAVGFAVISADGTAAVYDDAAQALSRTPLPTVSPTVVAMGVQVLYGVRTDDANTLFYGTMFDSTNNLGTLYLAHGTDMPVVLSTKQDATFFGDGITTDGKYGVYYAQVNAAMGIGQLYVVALAGGTPTKVGDVKGWVSFKGAGSKICYTDNWVATGGAGPSGVSDLSCVDAASPTAPNVIATTAESDFITSSDGSKVIFSYTKVAAQAGIYVAPIP